MSGKRRLGAKVLKAVSSGLRLNILRLLFEKGSLSYTEIMNSLRLSPSKDAGRFAYHLKLLLNMDLIKPDVESKKYMLTDLGKSVVEFAERLEESSLRKRLLVRSSRLAIEQFDRNRIAESLIKEAGVPTDLAQKIARETEDRLQKLDTKYLTAPLIREFVNAILIERGLEEYRHRLTRLGLPVYDVTQLIRSMSSASSNVEAIRAAAGNRVIEEYTLLNVLPRDIADAHLSGALNLENLACWILKLNGFMHDLRFFFRRGLMLRDNYSGFFSINPPKTFRSALNLLADALRVASAEVSSEQSVDFFNIFLAPFVKGLSKDDVKDDLICFLSSVNLTVPTGVSIGIETGIPGFLSESRALGPEGNALGVYNDYLDESRMLASLLLESLNAAGESKPIFNPSVMVKVRRETLTKSEEENILYEAHKLAVYGLPYFANPSVNGDLESSFTATGQKFSADWRGDWELDIIRVGCVGDVTVNLPRAFYEARGDRKIFDNVYDFTEKALRALEIKYLTLKQRVREGLLPFMIQGGSRDPYCRLENSLFLLSPVGLNEAAQLATKKAIYEGDEPLKFIEEASLYMQRIINDYSRRGEMRYAMSLTPNMESSRRMATLDVERYGLAGTNVSGSREKPYYSDLGAIACNANVPLEKYLTIEERLSLIFAGSSLAKIPLRAEADPEQLLSMTKNIVSNFKIPLFTYNVPLTYCEICHRTFLGDHVKCPSCGSVNAIIKFIREPARYKALEQ